MMLIHSSAWDSLVGVLSLALSAVLTFSFGGQPNVGKSSLLNALLGRKVVRASRTPGKTKTLQVRSLSSLISLLAELLPSQTIFWNRTIRLVDCPGLVVPSHASMEMQVLSGILPIQNVRRRSPCFLLLAPSSKLTLLTLTGRARAVLHRSTYAPRAHFAPQASRF